MPILRSVDRRRFLIAGMGAVGGVVLLGGCSPGLAGWTGVARRSDQRLVLVTAWCTGARYERIAVFGVQPSPSPSSSLSPSPSMTASSPSGSPSPTEVPLLTAEGRTDDDVVVRELGVPPARWRTPSSTPGEPEPLLQVRHMAEKRTFSRTTVRSSAPRFRWRDLPVTDRPTPARVLGYTSRAGINRVITVQELQTLAEENCQA